MTILCQHERNGLVIYLKFKVEEIKLENSRTLLCYYCNFNGALYNVYVLIMDDMPTFITLLLSNLYSYFYFCTSLRMLALSPMHLLNISDPISCKKSKMDKITYLP